ncbi:hypothetical protein [Pseudochrobactrum kiredjianiae]|uniref:DUF736 domain-containing protein n=1 Tax=Pseudochrobactrum kiredjianiae TaxID=386305 RepID=A0ABW3V6V1_9HYPH|nr:hypothetical protein [Pseudochrobactrum kiredjianiae]MDM7850164.1 hypothetical protein [Pseudochrobactrum kiredjianiae]
MNNAISLHVLCRYEDGRPKGLVTLDQKAGLFDSVSWRIKDAEIDGLIGKEFFMHEAKNKQSYLNGTIIGIRREAIADNDGEVRAIVQFKATKENRIKTDWPPTDNPNEYYRINYDMPLEKLR